MKALSVQQPWAWAIFHAGKDVENRSENMGVRARKLIGQTIFIHAGKTLDTEAIEEIEEDFGIRIPRKELLRGGVIGTVKVVDVVFDHASDWFDGECGIVLANPRRVQFQPGRGQLGFFEWEKARLANL